MSESKKDKNSIILRVDLTEKPERWPSVVAYLMTVNGRPIAEKEIRPEKDGDIGIAKFKLEDEYKSLLLKIGPRVEALHHLEKHRPYVKSVEIAEEIMIKIPKKIWVCWIKVPYNVTGSVKKVFPGTLAPICVGEVEIYDVDLKYCFLRIPEPIIERIRDGIIDIIVDPPPIPPHIFEKENELTWWGSEDDDWCGTGPKPPFPPKARTIDVRRRLETLPKEWGFATQRYDQLQNARTKANMKLREMELRDRTMILNSEVVRGVKLSQVIYSNTKQFRELIIKNLFHLKYFLCWWPWIFWIWWPYCGYSLELLGTATLNPDGSFNKAVMLSICRETPDLWFRVKQSIDGVENTIYARYPVPCNTYWNHPSGDPVDLLVTHPQAEACQELIPGIPDPYVMPMGVYEDEWYQVQDAHIKAHCDPTVPLPTGCGLYDGTYPHNDGTDPYGTRLDLRMRFHDAMYGYYYKWSYRLHGETDWTAIKTPINHRYIHSLGGSWVIESEKIGPFTVGTETGLFKVPDPAKAWLSNRNDLAYAIWHTAVWDEYHYVKQVPDGVYDLKLEIFDAGGNKVTPTVAGFKYILPTSNVGVVDDSLYVETAGELIMHLHIDNNDTVAEISAISINGSPAGECQFLEYKNKNTDTVEVEYVAYHPTTPDNFLLSYSLSVYRGVSSTLVKSKTSGVPERTSVQEVYGVDELLGPVFEQCAFSVWLHTYPRTRNGHSRIRAYEDSDRSSFALTQYKAP
jgi:hypothetical protein